MTFHTWRFSVLMAATTLSLMPASHAAEASCIVAGRVNAEQQWAPRLQGLELQSQDGKRIASSQREALQGIKRVRVLTPTLLSNCDGSVALTQGDSLPQQAKSAVPTIKADPAWLVVEAVNFPKLQVGGELVELRVQVPAERVQMLTR